MRRCACRGRIFRATREETDKAILRQLDLYERRMKMEQQAAWKAASDRATPARLPAPEPRED